MKIPNFVTEPLTVRWSHLHKADVKFGMDAANHNITVVVDDTLQAKLDDMVKTTGATKINGMRTSEEGETTLKAKTKIFTKKNVEVFPCVDAGANETEAVPFGGDVVRLRLAPVQLDRDNSISLFLNGVQIIEKNEGGNDYKSGFEATDGFDGSDFKAPVQTAAADAPEQEASDDLPF
tara:strand:+ start:875 stop:1408 length:534 start_codon:yes stop_codon:yes gene_type:complete